MPEKYITLNLELGEAYIKESKLRGLQIIDAVIFDCDGVLIDIRDSYNKAISKTVTYLIDMLPGCSIPEDLLSDETIFLFRRSGGFNNDWDIAYGITMFILSKLPRKLLTNLAENMKALMGERAAAKRLLALKEIMAAASGGIRIDISELAEDFRSFISMLDESGIVSVDRAICSSQRITEELFNLLKSFLYGSGVVGESIIATLFEEIFCGPHLFKEIYGISPEIYGGRGVIEDGRIIVKSELFNRLSSLIGSPRFGIASGSRFKSAKYVLGDILEVFDPRALVFLEDIEAAESEYQKRGFLKVNLRKPNPYPLFKSAWSLEPFRRALFIGDSIEDIMAVERANRLDPRFISAGVYYYTGVKEEALKEFLRFGCDIIVPSINDVPVVIEAVRGRLA